MNDYSFLCIDIVGSLIEVNSPLNNIEDLFVELKIFRPAATILDGLQTSFTCDGTII